MAKQEKYNKNVVTDALNGVTTMLENVETVNGLLNLSSSMYSGIMTSLIGLDITQFSEFNKKNGEVMRFHMLRNAIMKDLNRSNFGSGAYPNGNPYIEGIPVTDYSYSREYSYRNFSGNVHIAENNGQLTTSRRDIKTGKVTNNFFDYDRKGSSDESKNGALQANVSGIKFTGKKMDNESILSKTKRLFQANKINSIISQFHTSQNVRYGGQVGSDKYGESHGRNLLTKSAENGGAANMYNGFDNPYCRVWTHHYTYDRLSKTMRHPMGSDIEDSINYWGKEFEWNENDAGHDDVNKYGYTIDDKTNCKEFVYGENYDYAWRGHHNQQRRRANSVLDEMTGLVTIAPKFDGGGTQNVHTKACMFSIENLAWKDYDPYSFEQALSWEQRGPLGGRIMWFPPYNLKVTETNTAKWNSSEFIGRGEPVYTYTNSERTGTLSFTMLVDHPSSIDYASWHDTSGVHSDNDYHRYFAGCFGGGTGMDDKAIDKKIYGDVINNPDGVISTNGGDNLLEVPTNLTDEYEQVAPATITPKERQIEEREEVIKEEETKMEPNEPITVEFCVFFPNNYSGVYDSPTIKDADVHAILYLLFGDGAQKQNDGIRNLPLNYDNHDNVKDGYEIIYKGPGIGKNDDNYIQGTGYIRKSKNLAKWYYRVDSYLVDVGNGRFKYGEDNTRTTNTINQSLSRDNYVDNISLGLNSYSPALGEFFSGWGNGEQTPVRVSFTEVACAMYSESILNRPWIYNKLYDRKYVRTDTVDTLIDIFTTMELKNTYYHGFSNIQGHSVNNDYLASNRSSTVVKWLSEYSKFNIVIDGDNQNVSKQNLGNIEVKNVGDVNAQDAKTARSAHFKLEFTTVDIIPETQTESEITVDETTDASYTPPAIPKGQSDVKGYYGFEWDRTDATTNYVYYKKKPRSAYFVSGTYKVDDTKQEGGGDNTITMNQIYDLLHCNLIKPSTEKCDNEDMFGIKTRPFDDWAVYDLDDYVKKDGKVYRLNYAMYGDWDKQKGNWEIFSKHSGLIIDKLKSNIFRIIKKPYTFVSGTRYGYVKNDVAFIDNSWCLYEPRWISENWEEIPEMTNDLFNKNDVRIYEGGVYKCTQDDVLFNGDSNLMQFWEQITPNAFNASETYKPGDVVEYEGKYYINKKENVYFREIEKMEDIFEVTNRGEFNNETYYKIGDVCVYNSQTYLCVNTQFDSSNWQEVLFFNVYDSYLIKKIGIMTCITSEEVYKKFGYGDDCKYAFPIDGKEDVDFNDIYSTYGCENEDLREIKIDTTTNLFELTKKYSDILNDGEKTRLKEVYGDDGKVDKIEQYIIVSNILDKINYFIDDDGDKTIVCTNSEDMSEEMASKTTYVSENDSDCPKSVLWVDTGNGCLIRECELKYLKTPKIVSRAKSLNKLRYDQEYHFYKKYMEDHPFVFEKLREKIKYFNPAFHSMTPEGFNGRLTFLNQCTRQGVTMTKSDERFGTTATNLAFGRPPFCVLRLGDFYHQMIVIESVNYDFEVSGGLQWDLNTEGNGVQPMLCDVSISFKFIGGGDITGPVRRLQNAMSFNYYANTSFYDNRADRAEYQDTNWETMGGGGNNKIIDKKSYSYQPGLYNNNLNDKK